MKNDAKNQKKQNIIIVTVITASIVAVIAAFWIWLTPWVWYDNGSKPLGNRMEYLGKRNYGCWTGFCDSKPGATYYYATDMSLEEVIEYFGKAKLVQPPRKESESTFVWMKNYSDKHFTFNYYLGMETGKLNRLGLKTTSKYVIDIGAQSYPAAKESLQ